METLGADPHPDLRDALNRPRPGFGVSWQPEDDTDATWAFRVLSAALSEVQRMEEQAEAEIDRITAWLARSRKRPEATAAHFESLLIGYRIRCEEARPNFPATYKLPTGELQRRRATAKVDITDEKLFVESARENDPDALKVTPSKSRLREKTAGYRAGVDEKDLKEIAHQSPTGAASAIVSPDGEIVPGVELFVGPDTRRAKPT